MTSSNVKFVSAVARSAEKLPAARAPPTARRRAGPSGRRFAPRLAAGVGIGHGHADHEHERRLDQVPQRAAHPRHVAKLKGDRLPDRVVRKAASHVGQHQPIGGHAQHDEAAIGIERHQPLAGGRLGRCGRQRSWGRGGRSRRRAGGCHAHGAGGCGRSLRRGRTITSLNHAAVNENPATANPCRRVAPTGLPAAPPARE